MAINVAAKKRGWGYDMPNTLLNAYVDGRAVMALSANTSTSVSNLRVAVTYTGIAAVARAAIDGIVTYAPSTAGSGGSAPIGVYGRTVLTDGSTATLYMYAMRAKLTLEANSVLNGSIFAAIHAVLTSTATPTFTGGTLTCIYVENLIGQNMRGLDGHVSMMRLANNGGGNADMDCVFEVSCPEITNLFNFSSANNVFISGAGGATAHGGTIKRIRVDDQGTTYFLLMSTAPA